MGKNKSQKRDNKIVLKKTAQEAINDDCCPACGLHKDNWKRTKRYTCCSKECTQFFYKHCIEATSWQDLRFQIFKRDKHRCQSCGKLLDFHEFNCDHIQPIAAGGDMWDKNNLQTLCVECHKKKTKIDRKIIKSYISYEEAKQLLREVEESGYARGRPY